MTVVAYDGSVMAADTQALWSGDNVKTDDCKKIFKSRGHTFGIAGEAPPGNKQLIEWFFGDKKRIPRAEFTLLVIRPDGKAEEWDQDGRCEPIAKSFWAIGAAAEAALVGMGLGHSARETVAECIKHCGSVGGKVFWKKVQ